MFSFPLLQSFVIATFGFHDFASFRILVNLHLARFAAAGFLICRWCFATGMWIKQIDDVFQAIAVPSQQSTKLRFELNFLLKACITLQGFERLELFG